MTVTHSTTVSDVRVPWMTAWKMSRPKLSVPNGWEREGGWRAGLSRAKGSPGTIRDASRAGPATSATSTTPMAPAGRLTTRRNVRKRVDRRPILRSVGGVGSAETDTRIDESVDDIGDEVGQNDGERDDENQPEHHLAIAVGRRNNENRAESRPAED